MLPMGPMKVPACQCPDDAAEESEVGLSNWCARRCKDNRSPNGPYGCDCSQCGITKDCPSTEDAVAEPEEAVGRCSFSQVMSGCRNEYVTGAGGQIVPSCTCSSAEAGVADPCWYTGDCDVES